MAQNPCKCAANTSSKDETWGRVASPHFAEEIEKRSRYFTPAADHMLFREGEAGDRVFFVKSGQVVLTVCSFGEILANVSVGAGSVLGLSAAVSENSYGLSAKACANADIRELDATDLNELVRDCAKFSFEVSQILAAEILSVLKLLSKLVC
jgi:CRP-like cAMP-binding protein